MSLTFPKAARLNRAAEFQKLKAEGKTFHGKFMVLSLLKQQSEGLSRIGFITSRRVGGAVARNRVRRRLREIVRPDRAALPVGCWLALIARSRAADAAFSELRGEWRLLAVRAGVLAPDA